MRDPGKYTWADGLRHARRRQLPLGYEEQSSPAALLGAIVLLGMLAGAILWGVFA